MSTAHRPTFHPAVGGTSQGGNLATIPTTKISSRDLASQGTLKRRRIAKPLGSDLSNVPSSIVSNIESAPSLASLIKLDESLAEFADQDRDADRFENDDDDSGSEDSAEGSASEGDDSDDEEAELQRELDAIRKERELAARIKIKAEEKSQTERLAESLEETKLAKNWEEDAVFRVPVFEERQKKARVRVESHSKDFATEFAFNLALPLRDENKIIGIFRTVVERIPAAQRRDFFSCDECSWRVDRSFCESEISRNLLRMRCPLDDDWVKISYEDLRKFLMGESTELIGGSIDLLLSPCPQEIELVPEPVIRIQPVYNDTSKILLRRWTPVKKESSQCSGSEIQVVYSNNSVLDEIYAVQKNSKTDSEYRANMEKLLRGKLETDSFSSQVSRVHIDLYDEEVCPLSRDVVAMHKHLHTLHVLPVLEALKLADSAAQSIGVPTESESSDWTDRQTQAAKDEVLVVQINDWEKMAVALKVCYDEDPLQFPSSVVGILTHGHAELLTQLNSISDEQLDIKLPSRECQSGMVVAEIAFYLCTLLRDTNPLWQREENGNVIAMLASARKTAKQLYYKQDTFSRRTCLQLAQQISSILHQQQTARLHAVQTSKSFFRNLLNKLCVSHAIPIILIVQQITQSAARAPPTREAPPLPTADVPSCCCCGCSQQLGRLCFAKFDEPSLALLHVNCFLRGDYEDYGPVILGSAKSEPNFASSHLLAHRQNMMESVVGTRTVVLPDNRHVVMSTVIKDFLPRKTGTALGGSSPAASEEDNFRKEEKENFKQEGEDFEKDE